MPLEDALAAQLAASASRAACTPEVLLFLRQMFQDVALIRWVRALGPQEAWRRLHAPSPPTFVLPPLPAQAVLWPA